MPANLEDKSYLNTVRYKSARFESILSDAMIEINDAKRFDLYRQADQQAIDDGAIMPIFYDEGYRLIQSNVKNCPINAMEYRDMAVVYLAPIVKKEKK